MKVLITGGVRSGKSARAEALLANEPAVLYLAPGPRAEEDPDPDWAARIALHQARRPGHWSTLESGDLAGALRGAAGRAVLVDCLGTWLTRLLDEADAWDLPAAQASAVVEEHLTEVAGVLAGTGGPVVLVSNEVGLGVIPEHRSGRLFRDLLGTTNQRLAEVCDEVHLVVAGRVLVL